MAELFLISNVLLMQPFLHLYVIPCMLLSTVDLTSFLWVSFHSLYSFRRKTFCFAGLAPLTTLPVYCNQPPK
jgi:hypothetical protein